MQYFHQARHQSQHGVIAINWGNPSLQIARGFHGHIKSLSILKDGTFLVDATPLNKGGTPPTVEHDLGKPILPTIHNKRYSQSFNPPEMHKGKQISVINPVEAAQMALKYYSDVLCDAEARFVQKNPVL